MKIFIFGYMVSFAVRNFIVREHVSISLVLSLEISFYGDAADEIPPERKIFNDLLL